MSMFGFLKEWGSGAARINNSDRIIENLVGVNPKSYHPDIYKGILQEALNYESSEISDEKLNAVEFSAIRMGLFALIAENAEDYEVVKIYAKALGRLSRTCSNEISSKVRVKILKFTDDLSFGDYFFDEN